MQLSQPLGDVSGWTLEAAVEVKQNFLAVESRALPGKWNLAYQLTKQAVFKDPWLELNWLTTPPTSQHWRLWGKPGFQVVQTSSGGKCE